MCLHSDKLRPKNSLRCKQILRKSLDGSKAILKFEGDTPSCFEGLTTYNHSEILTELAKSAWTEEAE